jgi:CheY-like chemotaxis protein
MASPTEATILIIEDQEFTQRVIRAALRDRPFEILIASNGEDGYEILQQTRPDLVLLDLSLPGKDGWEVLEDMRQNPELASIPVIIVSAQGRSAVAPRAADLDISALINKPFRVPELRQAVEMALGAAEVA